MNAFTVKFDAFIEKGRKRVLEERNEFRGRLGELSGMCSHLFHFTFPICRADVDHHFYEWSEGELASLSEHSSLSLNPKA